MKDDISLIVTTPTDREIVMTRRFAAPRHLVFAAHTRADLLPRWMTGPEGWTMPVCEIDLKVGGGFRYLWRDGDGAELGVRGVFREIEPPARTVHVERFDNEEMGGETLVTTVFEERANRGGAPETVVSMSILFESRAARDEALATGMEEGMAASYAKLEVLLVSLS